MRTTSSSHTAAGDLSDVQGLTADALTAELAAAQAAMNASRHNRAGLAYTDAKLAVSAFSAEVARRAVASTEEEPAADIDFVALFKTQAGQHAAIRDALAPAGMRIETDSNRQCGIECTGATGSETCTCECRGRNHGLLHRAGRISTPETRARSWARIPAAPDDEPF